ncbi:unnamed protein product [Acanthoscelides obtectus]|uniref:Uncharacterized protein n=1 Tax=Acanthoscelides obtectus TaxID=200917 RepID=A0A9P0KW76_ACAOB|nr:unnamed protein product [Acanthoscelides obtectus]CAK1641207.1 hypothetical protein AOBTE_LOCUS12238 [Acanthoscelides obtectus]
MVSERRDFVLPFEPDSSDDEMETDEEGEKEPTRMTADSTSIYPSFPVCDSIETFVLADGDPDQSHLHHSTYPDSPGPCKTSVIPDEDEEFVVINGDRLSEDDMMLSD